MKKFKFSLDRVQQFKEQMLNQRKAEHGAILAAVTRQKELILMLEQRQRDTNDELNQKNAEGITLSELRGYQTYLRTLSYQIKGEEKKLEELRRQEEEKRLEMVEMKKETSSLEKLREKKKAEYDEMMKKTDALFIDEFVSNQRVTRQRATAGER